MVILSPGITTNGNISGKKLKHLIKSTSHPIVTIAKK